ncbi:MAG: hypothetical protein MZV65_00875 [Chromatiales bacterium]|nr:hypothetical protein [Chromatiales bacterium]
MMLRCGNCTQRPGISVTSVGAPLSTAPATSASAVASPSSATASAWGSTSFKVILTLAGFLSVTVAMTWP